MPPRSLPLKASPAKARRRPRGAAVISDPRRVFTFPNVVRSMQRGLSAAAPSGCWRINRAIRVLSLVPAFAAVGVKAFELVVTEQNRDFRRLFAGHGTDLRNNAYFCVTVLHLRRKYALEPTGA